MLGTYWLLLSIRRIKTWKCKNTCQQNRSKETPNKAKRMLLPRRNGTLWKSTSAIFSPCRQLRAISSIRKPRSSRAVAALCQRYLQADLEWSAFKWKLSRTWEALAWGAFSSAGFPLLQVARSSPAFPLQVSSSSQSPGSLSCSAPSPGQGVRETQAQFGATWGSWGRGTCAVSPATNFSYFGSWSQAPIKDISS